MLLARPSKCFSVPNADSLATAPTSCKSCVLLSLLYDQRLTFSLTFSPSSLFPLLFRFLPVSPAALPQPCPCCLLPSLAKAFGAAQPDAEWCSLQKHTPSQACPPSPSSAPPPLLRSVPNYILPVLTLAACLLPSPSLPLLAPAVLPALAAVQSITRSPGLRAGLGVGRESSPLLC